MLPSPTQKPCAVLIRIVEDPKQRDAVRAAAMVGILRHVEAGLGDDAPRSALTAAMLKLLTSEISSPLTVQGQVWIRGQAIETLGRLGSAGENGEVFKAILASLGDANLNALVGAELSYTTRCIAAKALGRLNYNGCQGDQRRGRGPHARPTMCAGLQRRAPRNQDEGRSKHRSPRPRRRGSARSSPR